MNRISAAEFIGRLNLNEIPRLVGEIYGVKDEVRSLWDVWLHANHHAAAIAAETKRPRLQERILKEIADFSFWLFTIVYRARAEVGSKRKGEDDRQSVVRIKEDLSDLLWNRHPGLCPSCYWRETRASGSSSGPAYLGLCECAAHPGDQPEGANRRPLREQLRHLARERINQKPDTIDLWQKRLGEIYQRYLGAVSLERIVFELLTQMGEVSDAIVRIYTYKLGEFVAPEPVHRQERFEDELGDLFRWLFLLVEKLNSSISLDSSSEQPGSTPQSLRLSSILWYRYGDPDRGQLHCPFCSNARCACRHVFVPGDASVADLIERQGQTT